MPAPDAVLAADPVQAGQHVIARDADPVLAGVQRGRPDDLVGAGSPLLERSRHLDGLSGASAIAWSSATHASGR